MRRTVCLLAVALLALPSLGSDSPKEYDGSVECDDLQGVWRAVALKQNGQVSAYEAAGATAYRAGKWEYREKDFFESGTYKTDTSFRPAHMDSTVTVGELKGRTGKWIYRVDGDTLWKAYRVDAEGRPSSFEEKGVATVICKRVK
jgi:uncharacterized protein (TIGR03067 family)